jgi:hypothetical protein
MNTFQRIVVACGLCVVTYGQELAFRDDFSSYAEGALPPESRC